MSNVEFSPRLRKIPIEPKPKRKLPKRIVIAGWIFSVYMVILIPFTLLSIIIKTDFSALLDSQGGVEVTIGFIMSLVFMIGAPLFAYLFKTAYEERDVDAKTTAVIIYYVAVIIFLFNMLAPINELLKLWQSKLFHFDEDALTYSEILSMAKFNTLFSLVPLLYFALIYKYIKCL